MMGLRRQYSESPRNFANLASAVCPNTVARLLHQMGYCLRVNHKQISTDSSSDRNLQFEYLAERRSRFQPCHLPIISVDTEKRERLRSAASRPAHLIRVREAKPTNSLDL